MIKRATLFAVFLLLASAGQWASAQLLNEEFDYPAGDSLNGIHNWTVQATASYVNTVKVVSPGLTYSGYPSAAGNAAQVDTTGQDIYTSFAGRTSGSVYAAALVNISKATTTGDYFFHFTEGGTTNFRGRVYAKLVGTDLAFGLVKGSAATAVYTPATYALNTTYLMVLKYTFNTATTTDDSVFLYIDPVIGAAEPAPLLSSGSTDADFATLSAVNLRQGSASNAPRVIVDGIRVDSTWKYALESYPVTKLYSIGTGNVPGETEHYASLKAACDSLNAHIAEVTSDRIYYITSDLTEPANVNVWGNTLGAKITFKPYTGVSPKITFTQVADNTGLSGGFVIGVKNLTTTSATNYGMTMNDSTKNFVIDGSNTVGGTTRDLSIITAAGISGNTNPIRIFGNTDNIVVKNTVISTGQSVSYAILITVRQTATVGYAGTYVPDSIMVDNCDITNTFGGAGQGIAISNSGTPTSFPIAMVFKNNKINARTRGILLNNSGNTDVVGNEISVTQTSTGNLSEGIFALTIGSPASVTNILNNKIQILSTANVTAGSYGIEGIQISSQGVYNVYNNIITGFVFPNLAQGIFVGIGVTTATTNAFTANIHYNSVYMANGSNTAGAAPPIQAAFYMKLNGASGTRTVNLMNNIFANLESDYATQAIFVDTANTATLVSNYNNLYSAGGSGMVGKIGPTNCATLADWQTAASQDANSVSGAPGFVSASDLHIEPTTYPVPVVSNAGTPLAEVTTDMDGDLRNASTPDIGADEYVANPTIPITGFSVSPNPYNFGNVWKDSTMTDSVTVTNHSTTLHLIVDSVKSSNPLFAVTPATADLDTSATKKFAVSFSPVAKGMQVDTVIFYHNAVTAKDTLILTGMGIIKEPLFTATPASVNFRGVLVGKSKMDSVTVKNTGTDSLKISAVVSSDGLFTVTPTSASLDTAASQKFYITFSPTAVGAKSAAIVFTSNVEEGADTVAVYGSGTTVISIADARIDANNDRIADRKATGDTVVVTGVITTPVLSLTQTSYFMQDASAGINLFSFNPLAPGLDIGDSVMVIGKIDQYRGLVELTPLTLTAPNLVVLKKNAQLPAVKKLSIHEFVTNTEMYEGQLVEVDTLYKASGTWPASGSFASIFLKNLSGTDTLQMFIDSETNVDESPEPAYPINLKGVISQYSSGSTVYNNGYELIPRDTNDITEITVLNVNDEFSGIPKSYALYNNYPNPFNPSTTILYAIPQQSTVEVKIYSILGQEVKTLVNDVQSPSYYRVVWNGTNNFGGQVSSGVYFVRVAAKSSTDGKSFVQVKKMLMMK